MIVPDVPSDGGAANGAWLAEKEAFVFVFVAFHSAVVCGIAPFEAHAGGTHATNDQPALDLIQAVASECNLADINLAKQIRHKTLDAI
jgi:hypothetical protein